MAQIQFVPAVLSVSLGVLAAVLLATFLAGRAYCSVVCPLGIWQDLVSALAGRLRKNRFAYAPPLWWLRLTVLAAFVLLLLLGLSSLAAFLDPYSVWGRFAAHVLSPLWRLGNNGLASAAAQMDSYAFSASDISLKGLGALVSAVLVVAVVSVLAWQRGRLWCSAVCPVGTLLSFVSRFAVLRPRIDAGTCVKCGLCEKACAASCIDASAGTVDAGRCIDCMACLPVCRKGAIRFGAGPLAPDAPASGTSANVKDEPSQETAPSAAEGASGAAASEKSAAVPGPADASRRAFVATALAALGSAAMEGEVSAKESDGGLAPLKKRRSPKRETPVLPPGAVSASNLARHCTGCQLCVVNCPNDVLRPSKDFKRWMQPEMAFENGRCRPECTTCSSLCPTGAIRPIRRSEKASIQIGHAVWDRALCLASQGTAACGNCARHCPVGAILMGAMDPSRPDSPRVPMVDAERCIGCGTCEHLCPVRPVSAIHVEGHEVHRAV